MQKIHTEKNKIVTESGDEIVFKGININSPCILKYQENHDFLNDIKNIKEMGANAVRVPICPAYFQSRADYCEEILDPIVYLCKELELYCLLDWHGQGNPITGETRDPENRIEGYMKYDARPEIAKHVANVLSEKYGKENHVLFEVVSSLYLGITDTQWMQFSLEIISIIRKNSNNIVVASAPGWPQNLSVVLENEYIAENVVFGIMVYPGTKNEDVIEKVKEKYPVVITECGYESVQPKEDMMKATKESYAIPLKHFLEKQQFSWFAWCYHPVRQPVLLRSWNPEDLSEWGKYVKEELLQFSNK